MRAKVGLLALLLLIAPGARAQEDVRVSAYVDSEKLTEEDVLQLTVSISGGREAGDIEVALPALRDFEKLGESTSQQITIVNNYRTAVLSYIYSLHPKRRGTLTIPAISVEVAGRVYRTDPISVQVVAAAQDERIIVRQKVSSTGAYVGQQITLTTEVFFREVNLRNYDYVEMPEPEGFVVLEEPMKEVGVSQEEYRGMVYYRFILRRQELFPVSPGVKRLEPIKLRFSFVEGRFSVNSRIATRASNSIEIDVKPLPAEDRPSDFQGAVGSYHLSWDANDTNGRTNEPLTLKILLTGLGDLERQPDVPVQLPDTLEVLNTKTESNITLRDGRWGGAKQWELVVVPRRAGELNLEPLSYPYFDPASGSYKTAQTQPLDLNIVQSETGVTAGLQPPVTSADVGAEMAFASAESDIRHIKASPGPLAGQGGKFFLDPVFWILVAAVPAANLVLLLVKRLGSLRRPDIIRERRRLALRTALKKLRKIEGSAAARDPDAAFRGIKEAVGGYLADKLGREHGGATYADLEAEMVKLDSRDHAALEHLRRVLETCDAHKYSPEAGSASSLELCRAAARTIQALDEVL